LASFRAPREGLVGAEKKPETGGSDRSDVPRGQNAPYARLLGKFRQSGFTFTQLQRVGDVAIYGQTKGKQSPAFEVVIIRRREASIAFGHEFPATEYYPKSEDWGTYGFTYLTLKETERKLRKLVVADSKNKEINTMKPRQRQP